jgi:hypothetical protein
MLNNFIVYCTTPSFFVLIAFMLSDIAVSKCYLRSIYYTLISGGVENLDEHVENSNYRWELSNFPIEFSMGKF